MPDAFAGAVIESFALAQCSSCQRNIGCVAAAGVAHTPVGLKSYDTKEDGVLICAMVKPFDAESCVPWATPWTGVVVSLFQYTSGAIVHKLKEAMPPPPNLRNPDCTCPVANAD
jgi:hypothetical protein